MRKLIFASLILTTGAFAAHAQEQKEEYAPPGGATAAMSSNGRPTRGFSHLLDQGGPVDRQRVVVLIALVE